MRERLIDHQSIQFHSTRRAEPRGALLAVSRIREFAEEIDRAVHQRDSCPDQTRSFISIPERKRTLGLANDN